MQQFIVITKNSPVVGMVHGTPQADLSIGQESGNTMKTAIPSPLHNPMLHKIKNALFGVWQCQPSLLHPHVHSKYASVAIA